MGNLTVNVVAPNKFTYDSRDWLATTKSLTNSAKEIIIDLSNTEYVDSSALGMILILRDKTPDISLVGCKADVRKILDIANFGKLFKIS